MAAASEPPILCLRIDDFPVAVARRARPAWREQALIVGGDAQGRGSVLAASSQARRDGVQPGQTLRAAEKLCPEALVLAVDRRAIDQAGEAVLEILGRYTPLVEPASVGGRFAALLDVSGCERLFGPPAAMAAAIGAALGEHGYQTRIGLAGNPSLAGEAAAMAPVGQPLAVSQSEARQFLATVPLALLEGFDAALRERLEALGIRTAGDFARLPEAAVRRRFGQAGRRGHEQARGEARRPLRPASPVPVLEVSSSLEEATADGNWLDRELVLLADRLADQLAARGQAAGLLTLIVDLAGRPAADDAQGAGRRQRSLHLKEPVSGAPALRERARALLTQLAPASPVAALCLRAADLGAAARQATLEGLDPRLARHERLHSLAQRLQARFGPRAARRVRLREHAVLPEEGLIWEGGSSAGPLSSRPLAVRADAEGQPLALRRPPRDWETCAVCCRWRLRANWWAVPVHRYYYLVETAGGAVLEIYQERRDGAWFLAGRRD